MTAQHPVSISRRLMIGLAAVIMASMLLVVALIAGVAPRIEEGILRDELEESTKLLSNSLVAPLWDSDIDRAEAIGHAFANDKRVVRISITEALTGDVKLIEQRPSDDTVSARHTVLKDGHAVGEVSLAFSRAVIAEHIRRDLRIAIGASLIALAAALVGVRLLVRRLLEQPIAELSRLASNYAAGDYTPPGHSIGFGELRAFSDVLTSTGEKVVGQLRELQESNARLAREVMVREEAEATLRLQGAALEAAANGIVITDRAGFIVWANPAFLSSAGVSAEETIGKTPGALLKSGKHDAAFYRDLWNTILAGAVWHGEIVNRRGRGALFTEELTITPLTDAAGEITHFIAVKQDITQRIQLEAQYRQLQKMESVGRLAGGVAHDFNNMLSVIIGHSELVLGQMEPGTALYADIAEVHKAATRSADLTRQLLTFARKQDVAPRVLDLNATVADSLKMLQRLIGENIRLAWQPATGLWPILMDPSQLDQILANLCVNARDAIHDVGTLTITTGNVVLDAAACAGRAEALPGAYVRLSVTDTGCGMSDEVLAQIFEPFFTTKAVGEGTGLGLATVYGAVTQNRGFVSVQSAVGGGTTFEVYLPRHEGALAQSNGTGPGATAGRGRETILLVEDEPMVLRLTTRALQSQGYTVLGVQSPDEALRVAREHSGEIDLLLTDVIMPGMNGRDLAKTLTAQNPRLEYVFMSGFSSRVVAGHGVDDDAHFLGKPFSLAALASTVRRVLDRRAK